jgi:carbamoyltransferase
VIVLGLNAYGHDAAAVLLVDGRPAFAASEERFDRVRHSAAFPAGAIRAALARAGIGPREVDAVAFPWTRGMARVRKAFHFLRRLPRSLAYLREPPDELLPDRRRYLRAMAGLESRLAEEGIAAPVVRVPHHLAHAESARLALPEGRGAVLTADGMGEWRTAVAWRAGPAGALDALRAASYPHSAGKVYAAVTRWLGFRPESDEGKTMGLAAYGDPASPGAAFARGLLRPDGRRMLRVRLRAFGYPWGEARLYGDEFERTLGPARRPGEPMRPGDADVARGVQEAAEEVMLAAARRLLAETGARRLALAGGLFLNCAMNGRMAREAGAEVIPFPVAGDAGAAWGAAALVHRLRSGREAEPLGMLRLGTSIDAASARIAAGGAGETPGDLAGATARRIAAGEVIGLARGRAEFGPRALGGRSVLATPISRESRDRVNRLKGREDWRPLAPVVRDGPSRWFEGLSSSPHMILTFRTTAAAVREIPGAVHADGTARVQTAGRADDPFLADLLDALERLGHPPAVLNTSLNRPGEPIADSAEEALAAARAMGLDAIVIADRIVDLRAS